MTRLSESGTQAQVLKYFRHSEGTRVVLPRSCSLLTAQKLCPARTIIQFEYGMSSLNLKCFHHCEPTAYVHQRYSLLMDAELSRSPGRGWYHGIPRLDFGYNQRMSPTILRRTRLLSFPEETILLTG